MPPCRVVLVAFAGCQALDVAGPADVFAAANHTTGERLYAIHIAATANPVETTAGFAIAARPLARFSVRATDTILVVGGSASGVSAAIRDRGLLGWLGRAAPIAARVGSVCTGAFVLGAAGLLDDRRAATHWSACARLAAACPRAKIDRDAIYVEDRALWTSAGVTAGIDMALAMVEADHGRSIADRAAAELVLYTRRLGYQSQWSAALVGQIDDGDGLGAAIHWARGHLGELDVARLARRAGMSERSLHRRCAALLKLTPAKLIEQLRVEHARALLDAGKLPAKTIARNCGFGDQARMTRAFRRTLGVGPRDYRMLFVRPP